jgi:hypothetical protein
MLTPFTNEPEEKLSMDKFEKIIKMGYPEDDFAAQGYYLGGDKIVEWILGSEQFLPFSIREIITAGIQHLSHKIIKLKNKQDIATMIRNSLAKKTGLSLIRVGDGELLTLAHDIILNTEEIKSNPRLDFLSYAGVKLPDHSSRKLLTSNLQKATIIGIPILRCPTYQNLFIKLANHHKWPLKEMCLTNSLINYDLYDTNLYHEILSQYKVLLIGNRMNEAKALFNKWGYQNIVGSIPVNGISDVSAVIEKAEKYNFDCTFVSAGIPANLICVQLAKEKNVVAIDFGHLVDRILDTSTPTK